jgi:hypothetical protein
MYFEVSIGKLSKVQLNNLLKGKNVRVKSGAAHTINLTEAQVKKFYKNTSKGKAFTVKLNQEQIAKQGGGILGDLVGLVHPTAGMVAKAVGLGMKKTQGKGILSDIVGLINPNAGMIAKSVGLGMKKKHGKGFFTDLAKDAAINLAKNVGKFAVDKGTDFAKDKASEYLKSKIEGLGMKKRKATSAQLAALAKGRAIRDANRYGGALYVA